MSSFEEAGKVDAVAHRVVHGGTRFFDPVMIDDGVMKALDEVAELAPLHNKPALAAIHEARRAAPGGPADRGVRHRLPSHDSRRGVDLRAACALARRVGHPPLRLPRPFRAVGIRAGAGVAARRVPPRRRLLRHRRARRPLGRHDHGLQPAGRRAHGDPVRLDRPGDRAAPPADEDARPRRDRARARVGVGAARPLGRDRRASRSSSTRRRRRRSSRCVCSRTASPARSQR